MVNIDARAEASDVPAIPLQDTPAVPAPAFSKDKPLSVFKILAVATSLALLTALFFWRIAFLGRILVEYDLFTYFYPMKAYERMAGSTIGIPLWNPYLYLGAPFMANIQTALFYPFNLALRALEPPQAVNVSILLHVFLAGFFMFLFAVYAMRVSAVGAFVGALVFMFGGFLTAQAGHINQLNASAWLPLLLLLFYVAHRQRSLLWAVVGGIVVAVQLFAGHTQEFYLSMATLVLYAAFLPLRTLVQGVADLRRQVATLDSPTTGNSTRRRFSFVVTQTVRETGFAILFLGIFLGLGLGLSAPQILPTFELSRLSIRGGGMSLLDASSFSLAPWDIPRAIFPGFIDNPYSEYIGYVGFLPVGLCLLALARARRNDYTWLGLALVVIALFFALGGYNPLYGKALQLVPGMRMFRVPARWLFVLTFGASMLSAIGMSYLSREAPRLSAKARPFRSSVLAGGVISAIMLGLAVLCRVFLPLPHPEVLLIWAPLAIIAAGLLLTALRRAPNRWLNLGIVIAVVIELFAARQDLSVSKPVLAEAYSSLRPTTAQLLTDPSLFRVLSIADPAYEPGDLPELRQILGDQMPKEQIDDFVVAAKYNEILTPNIPSRYGIATIDGYDGGVLPLARYVDLTRTLVQSALRNSPYRNTKPVEADGILREELPGIPDASLLGDLNVKYVIADRLLDPWVDNVNYDLAFTRHLSPSASLRLDNLPSFAATSVGLISFLSGCQDLPDDTPVAEVSITNSQGQTITTVLRAGKDTAEGSYQQPGTTIRHKAARVASSWKGTTPGQNYHTTIDLQGARYPEQIVVRPLITKGEFVLRGMTLIDGRTAASQVVTIDPAFRPVLIGDVKVYENLLNKPRAYLTNDFVWVPDDQSALARLAAPSPPALVLSPVKGGVQQSQTEAKLQSTAVVSGTKQASSGSELDASPGTAQILSYQPEQVALRVNAKEPAFLVLSDTLYPGWQATIDGQPTSILRANFLLRAVQVPAGEHDVTFRYQPWTLTVGWHIAEAAIAAILGLLAVHLALLWRRRRRIPISER